MLIWCDTSWHSHDASVIIHASYIFMLNRFFAKYQIWIHVPCPCHWLLFKHNVMVLHCFQIAFALNKRNISITVTLHGLYCITNQQQRELKYRNSLFITASINQARKGTACDSPKGPGKRKPFPWYDVTMELTKWNELSWADQRKTNMINYLSKEVHFGLLNLYFSHNVRLHLLQLCCLYIGIKGINAAELTFYLRFLSSLLVVTAVLPISNNVIVIAQIRCWQARITAVVCTRFMALIRCYLCLNGRNEKCNIAFSRWKRKVNTNIDHWWFHLMNILLNTQYSFGWLEP